MCPGWYGNVSHLLSLTLFAYFIFHLPDAQLCDASLGRGGVQRVTTAQKPREEQEHGRSASRPSPGLPRHYRSGR